MISARSKLLRSFSVFLALILFLRVPSAAYNPHSDAAVFYHGKSDRRIALSFDDGPLKGKTEKILDVLAKYGVHATFFMVGSQVTAYPETASRVSAEGHEIGNHTACHARLSKLSDAAVRRELSDGAAAIAAATGVTPKLFRPPEGVCTESVAAIAKSEGYRIILWNVDTLDWQGRSADAICETVEKTVRGGSVILMHDAVFRKNYTADALDRLIPMLQASGYEFVTVSELIDEN